MNISYRVPGPVAMSFDSKDLGGFKEGVIIHPRYEWEPITVDVYGRAPIDYINVGVSASVECVGVDYQAIAAANPWIKELFEIGTKVGTLAYMNFCKVLQITERDGSIWVADKAFLAGIADLPLLSTREEAFPLSFVILPDDNDKLWSALPNYFFSQ